MKKIHLQFSIALVMGLMALSFISCSKDSNKGGGANISNSILTTRGPMMTKQGQAPDYRKGVKFSDDQPGATLVVDSSQVNLNVPGTYNVIYTVTDADGNTTSQTETLRVVGPEEKIVYLTFDDGPSKNTPLILNILKQKGVHATFFVTAQFKHFLPYIADIEKSGNALAAHTYSHDFKIYTSMKTYFDDLDSIQNLIQKYAGHRTRIIRFPGGSSNTAYQKHSPDPNYMAKLVRAVQDSGYQYVDWNLSNGDASGRTLPKATLIRNACQDKRPQYCILMHDTGNKGTTVEALPAIIDFFKSRGYKFETITSVDYINHHKRASLGNLDEENTTSNQILTKPQPAKPAAAPAPKVANKAKVTKTVVKKEDAKKKDAKKDTKKQESKKESKKKDSKEKSEKKEKSKKEEKSSSSDNHENSESED